jgi:hypothetical protein
MLTLLRQWILSITAVGLLSAFALTLAGDTPGRKVVRLVSALALILAVLLPLSGKSADELFAARSYAAQYSAAAEDAVAAAGELTLELTAQSLSDYIEELAARKGFDCTADVEVIMQDGAARAVACELTGDVTDELRREIAAALNVDTQNVTGG